MTILNWSFPRKDISRSAQAYQLALALREEVADLEAAGCKVIQVCSYFSSCPFQSIFSVVEVLDAWQRYLGGRSLPSCTGDTCQPVGQTCKLPLA